MLGIPVNATARDISGNLGKRKLLEIGKDVVFPLDLPSLLPTMLRTSKEMDTACAAINLPLDKIRYSLFWFALPSEPMGKLAFDHLLLGNNDKALEFFKHSYSWESKLCLSVLCLQFSNYPEALSLISTIINNHCGELCAAVVGKTFKISAEDLKKMYYDALCTSIGGIGSLNLYADLKNDDSLLMEIKNGFKEACVDTTLKEIENEINVAKDKGNSDDPENNLDALNRLRWLTQSRVTLVRDVLGYENPRFRHLSDRLSELLRVRSIKYYNSVCRSNPDNVSKKVVETCLDIVEYATSICFGSTLMEYLEKDKQFLKENFESSLPEFVSEQYAQIYRYFNQYIPENDKTIDNAISLMKKCAPHIVLLKERPEFEKYYLTISTKVVEAALNCVIEEHNRKSDGSGGNSVFVMYCRSLEALSMMEEFDIEKEFKDGRYEQNRETLRNNAKKAGIDLSRYDVWINFDEFDLRTEKEILKDCCTLSDYEKFLKRYPDSLRRNEAVRAMERLKLEEERRRKIALNERETKLRRAAEEKALKEQKEKTEREAALKLPEDHKAFESCKTVADYRRYLQEYPDGVHRIAAMNVLSKSAEKKKRMKKILIWTAIIGGISIIISACGLIWGFENVLFVFAILAVIVLVGIIQYVISSVCSSD